MKGIPRVATAAGLAGAVLFIVGSYIGLFVAPAEKHMGDVQRMLYVHVPAAWNSLVCFCAAFVFAVASLWTGRSRWDNYTIGAVETGVMLNSLLLGLGMLWAKPTWGIWWTWGDVRLIFSFVMLLLFAGVLALRSFSDDPTRRATWTAIATIVAWVDVPLVYFCVRWWRSLHQIQSTPETVASSMALPMRINAFAVLFLSVWFIAARAAVERRRRTAIDVAEPPLLAMQEGT